MKLAKLLSPEQILLEMKAAEHWPAIIELVDHLVTTGQLPPEQRDEMLEAFRARDQRPGQYSYWDFQRGAWEKNDGIRIDHHLLSPQAADLLLDAGIDKEVRGREKPSDHVPVWIELDA